MYQQDFIATIKKNKALLANMVNLGFIQVSNILIQIILFPVIIRMVGIESFGYIAVANAFAGLLGIFINYGTNLSGIKDIALAKNESSKLSALFFNIYFARISLFILIGIVPLVAYLLHHQQLTYLLFATPIVMAELINPLFFFNGIEKLSLFNTANLLAKLSSAALIIICIPIQKDPWWVNFYLGLGNLLFFSLLAIYAIYKYQLQWQKYRFKNFFTIIKINFYLVCNNLVVHLQQSLFLFILPSVASAFVVGAYSLADKIISTFRMLIVAMSSGLYPKAALSYESQKSNWFQYKKKLNFILLGAFMLVSAVLYWGNQIIVQILTGSKDSLALIYIQSIALVPLLSAMNTLNIIELLIKNKYRLIFYSSLVLSVFVMVLSPLVAFQFTPDMYGYYPLMVEAAAIPITLYFIKRNRKMSLDLK